MTLATISYLCPLAMVTRKPMHVITTLYITTFLTLIAVFTTSLGLLIYKYIIVQYTIVQ